MSADQTRKIAILTQPLGKNYGGILQAYALQVILKNMGHQPWTVDRQHPPKPPEHWKRFKLRLRRSVQRYVFSKPVVIRTWPTKKELDYIYRHNLAFIAKNMRLTEAIDAPEKMDLLSKHKFDSYVVGSDQVWRPKYSPWIPNFFLDFLKPDEKVKKVAFSASFGVDELEYTPEELAVCAALAQKFDAISVREQSAIQLCLDHFKVDAIHTLDPTLLLDKEQYVQLLNRDKVPKHQGNMMTYVLDQDPDKAAIIQEVAQTLNLKAFSVFPRNVFKKVGKAGLEDCVYPSVTDWIGGFMDADYVVTDSFHGTAFAIIFNKPFIAIGNASRGISRFNSLLDMFGLKERLIFTKEGLSTDLITKPIDFELVNKIRADKKMEAINFLKNALK